MSKNPFKPNLSSVVKPHRNNFDLGFTNNLTFNIGQLIPAGCIPVIPGDSVLISAAMGLRMMPFVFPVQAKMKAYVHFFYQRNKNLWDEFNDFIYNNKPGLTPPYIGGPNDNRHVQLMSTGSIYDYLGCPTSVYSGREISIPEVTRVPSTASKMILRSSGTSSYDFFVANQHNPKIPLSTVSTGFTFGNGYSRNVGDFVLVPLDINVSALGSPQDGILRVETLEYFDAASFLPFSAFDKSSVTNFSSNLLQSLNKGSIIKGDYQRFINPDGNASSIFEFQIPASVSGGNGQFVPTQGLLVLRVNRKDSYDISDIYSYSYKGLGSSFEEYSGDFYKKYRLNSLRLRCYESIYNAFYRDARNNPLMVGSEPEYNKYLLHTNGGLDQNTFVIRRRNWEFDPFTSSVPSPQQGTAPLVGISSLGDVTFKSSEDGKTYTFSSETAPDADTITNIKVTSDVPNDVARAIVNTATQGISINDFRNVNAMQKWLETNIRRGLKIKDQTFARWGVDVKESILDMPEFIGGFSVPIEINQITQTSESETAPLGMYAGQGTGFGGSKHDIRCFCDQHGYIMAIISVVPEPLYDQLIDKDLFKFNCLDYYNPEFGQIGMQPVYKKEVAPLTTDSSNLESVFGYQRPWYDYLYKPNEIHGLFRTELRNFVLGRNFTKEPSLNQEFTTIDFNNLNNIFSVDKSHKILGQIRFNVTASRPIPSTHVPNLG